SLPHLEKKELDNRRRVAAFIKREEKIGIDQKKATKEFIKEASYTWINRLLGLKCMESRGLIEEVITTRPEYGDRSRYHRNFREKHPDLATKSDDGLIPCLFSAFQEVTEEIKVLFDPGNEYSLVIPRYPFLKKAIQKINDNLDYDTYREDEFLGWVYQYFNSREKDRVFEEVRTKKKKIAGSDIINVTQLYTEKYMVRFLVENSLGAMWMEMYPDSQLCNKWEYFVKDPNNSTREPKPVKEITFLDPASGSGHFQLYAFDLFYDMYLEEGIIPKDQIPEFILRYNLHGIDIDLRAIQLSALGLYMKAKSKNPDMKVQHMNLVSADAIMLDSEILEEFLEEFRDDPTAQELIKTIWQGLENVRELGSLLKVDEQIDEVIKGQKDRRLDFFDKEGVKSWEQWKRDLLAALKRYYEKAAQTFDINKQMFANEACKGVQLLDLLEQKYDVVATNPPYMYKANMGDILKQKLKIIYPDKFIDLYSAFIERCCFFVKKNGFVAMVTQHSFMFISMFEPTRRFILENTTIQKMVHLGPHAFEDIGGEKVNTVLFSIKISNNISHKSLFIKATQSSNKAKHIQKVLHSISEKKLSNDVYLLFQSNFKFI
ncbi:MAG: BREX-1 system adenine-specific DNA-methyltransferase PglX, partial [Anaerolineaceae bacterium]|nr:BREX-1 system adenine-specific DNA-methyltransferase PglX [Anaerolineaceae bacterium]